MTEEIPLYSPLSVSADGYNTFLLAFPHDFQKPLV